VDITKRWYLPNTSGNWKPLFSMAKPFLRLVLESISNFNILCCIIWKLKNWILVITKNWSLARIWTKKLTCFQTLFFRFTSFCVEVLFFFFNHAKFQRFFPKRIFHFFVKNLGNIWKCFCSSVNSTTFAIFWKHLTNFQYCKIEMNSWNKFHFFKNVASRCTSGLESSISLVIQCNWCLQNFQYWVVCW
jgi:hypothetical protein